MRVQSPRCAGRVSRKATGAPSSVPGTPAGQQVARPPGAAARPWTSTASSTRSTGGRSSSNSTTCWAWSEQLGRVRRDDLGDPDPDRAGSQMKFTCWKRPRTTVARAAVRRPSVVVVPAANAAAARAVALPTSVSGDSTQTVSVGPARTLAATTGENSGSRLALRTATRAVVAAVAQARGSPCGGTPPGPPGTPGRTAPSAGRRPPGPTGPGRDGPWCSGAAAGSRLGGVWSEDMSAPTGCAATCCPRATGTAARSAPG